MTLEFRIDVASDLVVTTSPDGNVTLEDLARHARALAARPERPLRELVDFSEHARITVPFETLRDTAGFLRDHDERPGTRVALVAGSEAVYGALRVFAAWRESGAAAVHVFRDRDAALAWLDEGDP
jgi:hypothetical protein